MVAATPKIAEVAEDPPMRHVLECGFALLIGAACLVASIFATFLAGLLCLVSFLRDNADGALILYPIGALIGTAVAGFIIGRILSREYWYVKLAVASPGSYFAIYAVSPAPSAVPTAAIIIVSSFVATAIGWLIGGAGRTKPQTPGMCPKCDYNLAGNTSGTCPECGSPIPPQPEYRPLPPGAMVDGARLDALEAESRPSCVRAGNVVDAVDKMQRPPLGM